MDEPPVTAETVFMGSPTVSHNAGLTTPLKGQALLRFCSSLQMICHSVLSLFASKKQNTTLALFSQKPSHSYLLVQC